MFYSFLAYLYEDEIFLYRISFWYHKSNLSKWRMSNDSERKYPESVPA